jgi:hypothetical protein
MEKVTQSQDDRLLDYLDGKLSGAEAAMLKNQLEQSAVLKQRLEELRVIHTLLSTSRLAEPSKNFTQFVMNNLDKVPARGNTLSPRNGLILLCGILVATGVTILLLATGSFDILSAPIQVESLKLPKEIVTPALPAFSVTGKTMMKLLVMLNIGLAFLVLDRTVLKPYFGKKHRSQTFS